MTTPAFLMWSESTAFDRQLRFDVVTTETHTFANVVTDQPVERGANVSDHVRATPDTVTLDVVVTNTPLDGAPNMLGTARRGDVVPTALELPPPPLPPGLLFGGIGAALSAGLRQPPKVQTFRAFSEFDSVAEIYATIKQLRDVGQLVSVISPLNDFDNMVITSVTVPRTAADSSALLMTIEFKQIRIVETRQTTEPIPTETRGKKPKSSGVKGGADDPNKKKKSVAAAIVSSFGGLF